ncbi:hypothetical protein CR513_48246, partial [Mucuna pruriens]
MGVISPYDFLQNDRFIWVLTLDGNFSTKTTYRLLKGDDSVRALKFGERFETKIFTPCDSLGDNTLCTICHMEDETIIHMPRDVNLGTINVLIAKFWEVFSTLQLAWNMGIKHIWMECDSKFAVKFVIKNVDSCYSYRSI